MCDLHKPVAEGPVEHSVPSRRGLHSRSRRRASVEAPERSHVSPRGNAMTVDSVAQRSADMRWMALGPRPVCFPRAGFPEGPATEGTTRSPANKMLPSVAEVIRSAASGEGSALRSAMADGLFARKEAKDLPVMQLPSTTTPSACSLNSFGLNSAAFTTTQLQALVIAQLATGWHQRKAVCASPWPLSVAHLHCWVARRSAPRHHFATKYPERGSE